MRRSLKDAARLIGIIIAEWTAIHEHLFRLHVIVEDLQQLIVPSPKQHPGVQLWYPLAIYRGNDAAEVTDDSREPTVFPSRQTKQESTLSIIIELGAKLPAAMTT
jgi:hypothetical protein